MTAQTVKKPLPFRDNFDSYDPSKTRLPEGWTFEGNDMFKIGAYNTGWVDPYTAPYYITVGYDKISYPRKDWLFTNGFDMEEGKKYFVNFWIYAPGYWITSNESESIKVTAGTGASSSKQTILIKDFPRTKFSEWTLVEGEFIAETTGVHYIGINIYTQVESNGIGIDNFEVYSEDNPFEVEANYIAKGGLWSAVKSDVKNKLRYVYADQDIELINKSRYATSYRWETFGTPSTSTEENVTVRYNETGLYEPILTATNKVSEKEFKDTVNVVVVGGEKEITGLVSNQDTYDGTGLRSPGDIYNNGYEFICGMNRYYTTYAERFDMPEDAKVKVNALSLMLWQYKCATKERNRPVYIKVYGDGGGVPDPDKVFGTYTTTLSKAFGTVSVVEEGKAVTITFDKPIEATGTFYIAIEIDPTLRPSATTLLGSLCFKKIDKDTKAYVYIPEYEVEPDPSIGVTEGWYPLEELPEPFDGIEGLSFYFAPSLTFMKKDGSSINDTDQDNVNVYPTVFNEVLNVEAGNDIESIAVYNINGQKVYEAKVNDTNVTIPSTGWSSGVYFVNVKGNTINYSVKVVKL